MLTKASTFRPTTETPNKKLQAELRKLITADGIYKVSEATKIGRDTLVRYLADLPLRASTLRGVEATISSLGAK